ncbi:GtrA family protein [Metabacillus malikii]|uniref:Flippase GtrA n=1 Tax=Metabacillus malikii TaxID=1504265 RepID=A0ABT9ZN31_9BACI|nr:GtrA family protein [Metabacillus malikii]MDQ0233654.1 putative flippase GtrA [Metabacillus malikii]
MENYLNRISIFSRFLLVGILNTCIGLSIVFLSLHALNMSYWSSTLLGNSVGACFSYILNRNFTFGSNVKNSRAMVLFFFVVSASYLIAYQIGYHSLLIVAEKYSFITEDILIVIAAMLYTCLNYFGQKFIAFKRDN